MTTYYVDTSALIKRYVNETGSSWLKEQLNIQSSSIIIVHLAIVEVTSVLNRRVRENILTVPEYNQIQNAFQFDCLNEYDIVTASRNIINVANKLLETHPLRSYDAIHLAAAITINQQLLNNSLDSLTFLSVDDQLNKAASAEGLAIDNPNQHP